MEDPNNDKGPGGYCDHCLRSFENLQQFLRHVSHSKTCLAEHDPDVIESLKRESRLRTKKNWYQRNKDDQMMKKNNVKKATGKSYYIPVEEKATKEGVSFSRNLKRIYEECSERACKMVSTYSAKSKKLQENLQEGLIEKVLDHVFEELLFKDCNEFKDDGSCDSIFVYLENKFHQEIAARLDQCKENWTDNTLHDIRDRLYEYALRRAFFKFFREDKFKNAFKIAEGICQSNDFSSLDTEVEKACRENGLQEEMKTFMETIFVNRFRKHYFLEEEIKVFYEK